MGDKMKCENCGAWMSSESGLAVCEDCRPRYVKEPPPPDTISVRIAVRVHRDGSWLCDGQTMTSGGHRSVHPIMGPGNVPPAMDDTVYITANLPRPAPGFATVEGTVE